MNKKARYRELCRQEVSIPLFLRPEWMDAICEDSNWDVVLVEDKQRQIIGAIPYQVKRKWGITAYSTPLLTPTSGPWVKLDESKPFHQQLSQYHRIIASLTQQLQSGRYYYFKLTPTSFPGHAWYWAGYTLNTMYTYRLDISSAEVVFNHCKNSIRTDIRNAEKEIRVEEITTSGEFYELLKKQVGGHYQYLSASQIDRLFLIKENKNLYFRKAVKSGKAVGAALFVKDRNELYYLIGTRQMEGPNPALTSLIWHHIQEHTSPDMVLDFEGTMLRKVEPFFRRFGGMPTPYLNVVKMPRWMKLVK